jgi:hypothetical protein
MQVRFGGAQSLQIITNIAEERCVDTIQLAAYSQGCIW